MAAAEPSSALERWALWANLVLPGSGMILVGALASGLLGGLVFAVCANFALAAVLLVPDDFSATAQALAIGTAAGAYVGAQGRCAGCVRAWRAQASERARRRLLWQSQELLARGDAAQAAALLRPLVDEAPDDLLVIYRLAQALTVAGDVPGARAAWQQLRQLDCHGLYKQQILDGARLLDGL